MPSKPETCIICDNKMQAVYNDIYDDRYGYPGLFEIYECEFCGQMKTVPTVVDSDLYTNYYPRKEIDIDKITEQLVDLSSKWSRFKSWIKGVNNQGHYYAKPGMMVLDYGCGTGTSLLELRTIGVEGYGVEADANIKKIAERYHLNIHVGKLSDNPFPDIYFDLIILNQVVEHIPDPLSLIKELLKRLTKEGMIVLSFPNADSIYRKIFGRYWINWHVPYHLHYFNKRSIKALCKKEEWQPLKQKTITPNIWTVLQFCSPLSHSSVGSPNPLWHASIMAKRNDNSISEKQNLVTFHLLKRIIRRGGILFLGVIIAVVNRIIDILEMGDSLLVIIKKNDKETNQ